MHVFQSMNNYLLPQNCNFHGKRCNSLEKLRENRRHLCGVHLISAAISHHNSAVLNNVWHRTLHVYLRLCERLRDAVCIVCYVTYSLIICTDMTVTFWMLHSNWLLMEMKHITFSGFRLSEKLCFKTIIEWSNLYQITTRVNKDVLRSHSLHANVLGNSPFFKIDFISFIHPAVVYLRYTCQYWL